MKHEMEKNKRLENELKAWNNRMRDLEERKMKAAELSPFLLFCLGMGFGCFFVSM